MGVGTATLNRPEWGHPGVHIGDFKSIFRRKLEGPPNLIRPKWGYIGAHYGQFLICV